MSDTTIHKLLNIKPFSFDVDELVKQKFGIDLDSRKSKKRSTFNRRTWFL